MKKLILLLTLLLIPVIAYSAPPTRSYTYTNLTLIDPEKVTANEDNIYTYLQGGVDTIRDDTIVNADISSSAAIADSKLAQITTASKVSTTAITGTLGISNGGTNSTTAQGALNTLAGAVTANRVLRGDGSNIGLAQVNLTTDVTGTLPVGNGGTGATATANGANGVVVLDGSSKLPAVDGSQLTGIVVGLSRVRATLSVDQDNLSNGSPTKVALDTETYDILGEFASYKFTVTLAGYYLITARVTFNDVIAAKDYVCAIYKDNAVLLRSYAHSGLTNNITAQVSDVVYLAVGAYIELYAISNAGVDTVDVESDAPDTYLAVNKI